LAWAFLVFVTSLGHYFIVRAWATISLVYKVDFISKINFRKIASTRKPLLASSIFGTKQ